ncbi:NAD(P)/FAD-dependent oxidoreductase [Roseibium algae]|uniref:FAD-dependent oxidoreductase n=1 Tax=Roseibium algae TaxID=3123038 RepID=A0ABU8TEK2_9HYPH
MKQQDKILIIGGGFGGARVANDLAKAGFNDVTLVDRKDYFEVTYSTLRTLVQPEIGDRARMKYAELINCKFVQGDVSELRHNEALMADGQVLPFDYAVVATGSSYGSFPVAKSDKQLTIEGRKKEFTAAHDQLENASSVLIIGGGPVGVELAGEIIGQYPQKSVTLAQGSGRLLDALAPKASRLAETQLASLGVNILLNTRLSETDEFYRNSDVVYLCVGQKPNTALMQTNFAGSVTDRGLIKVDASLRVEGTQNLYALGDCSNAPGLKLGYLADIQATLLAKNIVAAVQGKRSKPYKSSPDMALIPIGPEKGFVQLPFMVTTFRPLVNMKQKDMFISRQYGNLGIKR